MKCNWIIASVSTTHNDNLYCIEVDDVSWATTNLEDIDVHSYFSTDCNNQCSGNSTGIIDINNNSQLIRITNMLGQETPYRKNTPLFYIYDDVTVEKKIIIE